MIRPRRYARFGTALTVCVAMATYLDTRHPAARAVQTADGAISGVVLDGVTQKPVPGTIVTLIGVPVGAPSGAINRAFITDARGRFVFPALPASAYGLSAARMGYLDQGYGDDEPQTGSYVETLANSPPRIVLAAGQWRNDLKLSLWRPGSISGVVRDDHGEPLVGRYVRAVSLAAIAGHAPFTAGATTVTDDRGQYAIGRLVPGRYAILVTPFDLTTSPEGVPAAVMYPRTYYSQATTAEDATPVSVAAGQDVAGIDVTLAPVASHRVAGRIVSSPDTLSDLKVRLFPSTVASTSVTDEVAIAWVANDGSFEFPSVPPGDFTLVVDRSIRDTFAPLGTLYRGPRYWQLPGDRTPSEVPHMREPSGWARVPITVGDRDIRDLTVTLQPTATLTGTVIYEDGVSPPFGPIIFVWPASGTHAAGWGEPFDDQGHFVIRGLTGRYFVGGPPTGTVRSEILDGVDYADRPIDFSGATALNITITMTKGAQISGVVHGDRDGAGRSVVLFFPLDRQRWPPEDDDSPRVGAVLAKSDGAFQTPSRLPGDRYYVVAVPDTWQNRWKDPGFLDAASRVATVVDLGWGEVRHVDLALQDVRLPK